MLDKVATKSEVSNGSDESIYLRRGNSNFPVLVGGNKDMPQAVFFLFLRKRFAFAKKAKTHPRALFLSCL